jgi:hypothetical protein
VEVLLVLLAMEQELFGDEGEEVEVEGEAKDVEEQFCVGASAAYGRRRRRHHLFCLLDEEGREHGARTRSRAQPMVDTGQGGHHFFFPSEGCRQHGVCVQSWCAPSLFSPRADSWSSSRRAVVLAA